MTIHKIYILLFVGGLATFSYVPIFSQKTSYYGHDMSLAVREESSDKKYVTIQLAGGIIIRDYDNTSTEYSINDHLGSIRTIINEKLENKVSCDYDPYGNIVADVPIESKEQCRYTKTYQWSNTSQLYRTPTRVYQPIAKRFLSIDAMRYNFSPYLYVNANPIYLLDKYGTAPTNYDEVYKNVLYYELSPQQEKLMGHPDLPSIREGASVGGGRFNLDPDSYATLKQIKEGNAFVGILNYTTGDIYLSPVARRQQGGHWNGSDFEGEIRMMGKSFSQIKHGALDPISGVSITAHRQLAQRVDETLGHIPSGMDAEFYYERTNLSKKYFGFGIRIPPSQQEGEITLRSRSLNSAHMHREFNIASADAMLYQQKFNDWFFNIHDMESDDIPYHDGAKMLELSDLFQKHIEQVTRLRVYTSHNSMICLGDPEASFEELTSRATIGDPESSSRILYHNQFVYDNVGMPSDGFLNKSYSEALFNFFSSLATP